MPRIKGKTLVKFNSEELRNSGKSDLKQYISMEMIVRMIPKSIWNHVNGLLGTGEFELIGTTICKKSIDASVRLDITKAANDPIANRDVKIANIEENTAAIITSDTTPVEENTTPAE